jgi:hypothetical protein
MAPLRAVCVPGSIPFLALAILLSACGKDAAGPAEPDPVTEADVVGTWRTSVPIPGASVKVIMEIREDHSVTVSQKFAGVIKTAPDSLLDVSAESGTWSLAGGKLASTKTHCLYGTSPDYKLAEAPCTDPIAKEYRVAVTGNSMTVVENTSTYLFIRD